MREQYRLKSNGRTSTSFLQEWSDWVDRYDENGRDWWYNAPYLQYEFRGKRINVGNTVRLAECASTGTVVTVGTDENGYHLYQAIWDDFPNDDNYYTLSELVIVL